MKKKKFYSKHNKYVITDQDIRERFLTSYDHTPFCRDCGRKLYNPKYIYCRECSKKHRKDKK